MALDNFIPTVWAAEILRALDSSLVYANGGVINRDYEGEIREAGDSVKINMIGDVTVNDYTKNTDINSPEALNDGDVMLKVDQQKYFNFQIDDIDKAQTKPKVRAEAARRASYGLRKVIDGFIAGLYTDIPTANSIGTDGSPITGTWLTTGTLAYDRLVDLGVLLDNTETPDEGRFVVVPPWFEGYLLKDDRFVSFGTAANMARLLSGSLGGVANNPAPQPHNGMGGVQPIGRAAGFDVYKSTQVKNTSATKYKIIAGHPMAWSFAQQVLNIEGYRPEKRFGDALKGLVTYGAKVVRPENLALLTGNST